MIAALAALALVVPSEAWVVVSEAELVAGYDQLWAVSDVHGHREELERLLRSAGLASEDGGELHWAPNARRQLLIVVGDLVDGGPDSGGVVRLVARLSSQAPEASSRVVVLLGNHEVRKLLRDGHRKHLLRSAAAAAFVGRWLFAHSGYIDADPDEASLKAWFEEVARRWAAGGRERYAQFLTGRSILDFHDWWTSRKRREAMRHALGLLGLDALVFGHDPSALRTRGRIAIDAEGAFLKLDTGLKESSSKGMLLRCEVTEAMRRGLGSCRALLPDGTLTPLPEVSLR
jgi:hypothetical protein